MAQRLPNPFLQFVDSAGAPYSGGTLAFYQTLTSTPLAVYSDETLSTSIGTTVTLNAQGRPSTAVFLQNVAYKVTLTDASSNLIWTADPVYGPDLLSSIVAKVGSGSPSGLVAGTAGSSGVLPTMFWDYTNAILYVCTTTGTTLTAVWTAINAAAATPVVTVPQGYLTPTSATPVIVTSASAATAVYYTPFVGNLVPIYSGLRFVPTEFTELTLTLHSSHAINTIYDVFAFSNSGVLTLVTGPAWSNSASATGARGTGAGTTQLSRINGYWTNTVAITGRNGSSTYSVSANLGTYLGSVLIDGTAGQVTCNRAWVAGARWGVWNAYNRQPVYVKGGDATATWTYNSTFVARPSNNSASNGVKVFCGLAEEPTQVTFQQYLTTTTNAAQTSSDVQPVISIGWNSTSSASGTVGTVGGTISVGASTVALGTRGNALASYNAPPVLGMVDVYPLEAGATSTNGAMVFSGTEQYMALCARWRG